MDHYVNFSIKFSYSLIIKCYDLSHLHLLTPTYFNKNTCISFFIAISL